MNRAAAFLLADGRFPAGGHAHSGGVEPAVAAGRVFDLATLQSFLEGRLVTTGLVLAGLAAAACSGVHDWEALDAEADARIPSPALRLVSRTQGRQLLRSARAIWDRPALRSLEQVTPAGPHHPVALGAAAAAAGLEAEEAARIAAYGAATAGAAGALRLLGLDPVEVHRLLAGLSGDIDEIARRAGLGAAGPLSALPCAGAPQSEIWAQWHAAWEVRLFAS